MKRNFFLIGLVILLSIILIYPLGRVLNLIFFHEMAGGGFDVGLDDTSLYILLGFTSIPPILSSLIFGLYGTSKWKWFFAAALSVPSVIFVVWLGVYQTVPLASFLIGIVISIFLKIIFWKT